MAPHGIARVLICGSHTHHGPVIELTDRPGFGKDRFDDAVAYARDLPGRIVAAILEADEHRKPAKLGVASKDVGLNRNRHTKRPVRPTDPRLTVVRFDQLDGSPIAVLVHYTAHPVLTPSEKLLVLRRLSRLSEGSRRGRAEGPVRLHPGGGRRPERQPTRGQA